MVIGKYYIYREIKTTVRTYPKAKTKPNLSLYSSYYAEACDEFAVPFSAL